MDPENYAPDSCAEIYTSALSHWNRFHRYVTQQRACTSLQWLTTCCRLCTHSDFFVTWKYCGRFPLWSSPVFGSEIKASYVVFVVYGIVYFIIAVSDVAPILFTNEPRMKCFVLLAMCAVIFCISPFLLYSVFAAAFSFQSWTVESSDYSQIKWIYTNIIQYLQNDINQISLVPLQYPLEQVDMFYLPCHSFGYE